MNNEMHGKQIASIVYPNDETVSAKDQKTLMFSATYHGDRDEHWVIEYDNMVETRRHNCRRIAVINWVNP